MQEWFAYSQVEPVGLTYWQLGLLAQQFYNVNRKKGAKALTIADMLPIEKPLPSIEQQKAALKAAVSQQKKKKNGKSKRNLKRIERVKNDPPRDTSSVEKHTNNQPKPIAIDGGIARRRPDRKRQ